MNEHDREVALIAGIAAIDTTVATIDSCVAGARTGAEAELVQLPSGDAMAHWESGFIAGLTAAQLFIDLARQHVEVLRAEYRELKGMDRADGN